MKKIFTILFAFVALSVSAQTYYNGQWYSMLSNQEYSIEISGLWGDETQEKEFTVFAPTESTMTYQWKNRKYFVGNNYGSLNLDFYESTNGSTYGSGTTVVECGVRTDKTTFQNDSYTIQNPNTLRKFKFSMHTTYGCTVANLRLPMKHHILFENGTANGKGTWDDKAFGELAVDEVSEPYMVNFRSFYTTGDLTITSSNPEIFRVGSGDNTAAWVYAVGANACATKSGNGEAGGSQLGNVANYNFGVYFCPKAAQEYEGTITISDGTNTCTFNVTGTGVKVDQTINWEPAEAYAWEDEIALASATSGLEVTYEISDPAVLKFENGAFVKLHAGEVTVTAKQAGNYKFNAAENVARTFTIVGPATSAEENKTIIYGAEETWNGYDLSTYMVGSHEITFDTLNVYGGAHTITLHLTVNKIATLNVPVELAFCAGGSESYRGVEYTEAGTYPVNATGATRDTVYNVTVTVLQPTFSADTKTITYGAEEFWNGIALADSTVGVHTVTYVTTNAAGCDSTVTLNLTVNKIETLNVPVELAFCAGGSENYRGVEYTEAGLYPVYAEGEIADTVYNVNVTVLQPTFSADTKTITYGAEEFWNGIALADSTVGVHTVTYVTTNAAGCDSTVTLNLTVNKIETLNVPVELAFCAGGSESYRGVEYTEAGLYPVYAEGEIADTVYNVTVTVLQPTFGTDSKTIAYGAEVEWNGIDLSEYTVGSHKVPFVTTNAAGCDSTVTLNLIVTKTDVVEIPVALVFCEGDSVEYRGTTYNAAGLYPVYAEGEVADTIYNVTVTVNMPFFEETEKTIQYGDAEEWHGFDLSELKVGSHILVDSLQTINGCDSIMQLTLTVEKMDSYEAEKELDFCEGDSVEYRGVWYSIAGEYPVLVEDDVRDTLINVFVTVHEKAYAEIERTVLAGNVLTLPEGEWTIGDQVVSGTYETLRGDTLGLELYQYDETEFGCESVVKLIVAVTPNYEAIDHVFVGEQAEKFFREGQLYIRRGEEVYTITGERVE